MKRALAFSLLFLFAVCVNVNAQQQNNYIDFGLGLQIYHHEYEEPGLMKNDGIFYGLSYSLFYENKFYFGLEGLASYGQVDYSSTSSGTLDNNDDICFDTRGILGYIILDDEKTKAMPYIGIAYRFLRDDSKNKLTSTSHLGYVRKSNYYYSPVGIRLTLDITKGWSLNPEIEYDYFWSGKQESDLGYVAGYEDIENDQDNGYGYRLSIALNKKAKNLTFGFRLFYRYWDIDESDITRDSLGRSWVEPANDTSEYGMDFSLFF